MKVNVGMGVNVAGIGVRVSAEEILVDVKAGTGEPDAGVSPALPRLQASVVNIRRMGRMYFEFFMA